MVLKLEKICLEDTQFAGIKICHPVSIGEKVVRAMPAWPQLSPAFLQQKKPTFYNVLRVKGPRTFFHLCLPTVFAVS